jgi:tetratricopeptide (TPR) repeat protein
MNRAGIRAVACLAVAFVLCVDLVPTSGTADPGDQAGREALDYAFRFASAIERDTKDRGKAQKSVAMDFAAVGLLDEAASRSDEIEGWYRGVAYADLATAYVKEGRPGTARELVAKATRVREDASGWHGPRISAHIAQALAVLGESERSARISADLASADEQYIGRALANAVSAHVARGEIDEALGALEAVDEAEDLDVTWWRTVGYMAIAREEKLARAERARAAERARRSAKAIPGWKQAEALESIATVLKELGKSGSAHEALEDAEAIVRAQPDTMPVKAPLMSNLARAWVRTGARDRARRLLKRAEEVAAQTLNIDRPGIYANVASSYMLLGDEREGWRVYGEAVAAAEELENARPRALAIVAICRSMGRNGVTLKDETRERLDRVYAGLGDPW